MEDGRCVKDEKILDCVISEVFRHISTICCVRDVFPGFRYRTGHHPELKSKGAHNTIGNPRLRKYDVTPNENATLMGVSVQMNDRERHPFSGNAWSLPVLSTPGGAGVERSMTTAGDCATSARLYGGRRPTRSHRGRTKNERQGEWNDLNSVPESNAATGIDSVLDQ